MSGADSYEIQRFGGGTDSDEWGGLGAATPDPTTATAVTSGTEYTDDDGLSASTTYLYRVRMVKEGVMSGWSAVASGTTRAAAPGVPTLSATTTGQNMIRLSWEAVAGATNYHLEFLEGVQAHADFEDVNTNPTRRTISGNFRHYVHTGLKAGTQYSYRLRAVLPSGNGAWTSDGSGGLTAQTVQPWTKPAPPDLTATATDSATITLSWTRVTLGSGRLGDATLGGTYRVERRLAGSGDDWTNVDVTGATCTDAHKCTLADGSLDEGKRYQYRIRAEAADGATVGAGHNSYWDYTFQRTPAAGS